MIRQEQVCEFRSALGLRSVEDGCASDGPADVCRATRLSRCSLWSVQRGFARKSAQLLLVVLVALALSGCSCSMFSKSTGCQLRDAGLVAVLLPVIAVDRLGEHVSDGRKQHEQRRLVLAGDPPATILCMQRCRDYSHLDDRRKLAQLSVRHILDWWDANPAADQMPALIDAHRLQGASIVDHDSVKAAQQWRRAAELAADPRIRAARVLKSADGYRYIRRSDLDRWLVDIEGNLLVLRYRGDDGTPAAPSILDGDCHPVSSWPPAWMKQKDGADSLKKACRNAYIQVFNTIPPPDKPVVNPPH